MELWCTQSLHFPIRIFPLPSSSKRRMSLVRGTDTSRLLVQGNFLPYLPGCCIKVTMVAHQRLTICCIYPFCTFLLVVNKLAYCSLASAMFSSQILSSHVLRPKQSACMDKGSPIKAPSARLVLAPGFCHVHLRLLLDQYGVKPR